jgi:anti-sigma factor RsiW
MRLKSMAILAATVVLAGCYHTVVTTSAPPSPQVVERPWQHTFIYGLVPPPEVNVKDQCTNGVSKVETLHSPANVVASLLLSVITLGFGGGLWTPMSVKVTCAAR